MSFDIKLNLELIVPYATKITVSILVWLFPFQLICFWNVELNILPYEFLVFFAASFLILCHKA